MERATSDAKPSQQMRRRRRSQEEVLNLIRSSALHLFAERGFAGTTTQEIARRADVSETLLFTHFGDKAKLYDAVVSAPFRGIMDDFIDARRKEAEDVEGVLMSHRQAGELFDFFEANRAVFSALVFAGTPADDQGQVELTGLELTFRQAAEEVRASFDEAGREPPFDAQIAVRLAFGMVAASVLLRPLLFSGSSASSDEVRECIMAMIPRAIWPRQRIRDGEKAAE